MSWSEIALRLALAGAILWSLASATRAMLHWHDDEKGGASGPVGEDEDPPE